MYFMLCDSANYGIEYVFIHRTVMLVAYQHDQQDNSITGNDKYPDINGSNSLITRRDRLNV